MPAPRGPPIRVALAASHRRPRLRVASPSFPRSRAAIGNARPNRIGLRPVRSHHRPKLAPGPRPSGCGPRPRCDPADAAKTINDFFKNVLIEESYSRFDSLLTDPDKIVSVDTLGQISAWLVEVYTARPTEGPEVSSTGA